MRQIWIWIGRGALSFFLAITLLTNVLYFAALKYEFPPARPFHGDHFYNPYQSLEGSWKKANFQVASHSWGGVTDGGDSAKRVVSQYKKYDYDIISISDYQKINTFLKNDVAYIPNYEFGYNLRKRHYLNLGARYVNWYDLPFSQTVHQKQFIINLLKPHSEFLVIAHPVFNKAFSIHDMAQLSGYDAIEVFNHYRNSVRLWDAALSAGRRIWALGNDDSHNVMDLRETMTCWTMVNTAQNDAHTIIESLKTGCSLIVDGHHGRNENMLRRFHVKDGTIDIELLKVACKIRFIGQNGIERKTVKNARSAHYKITAADTYIRTEIEMPNSKIYLNPVYRYQQENNPSLSAVVDWEATWIYRAYFILIYVLIGLILLQNVRLGRLERKIKMAPATATYLTTADV